MDEKSQELVNKFLEDNQDAHYPSEKAEIRNRYCDTALLLFKQQQGYKQGSFLSFGSRRSSVVSSYGNTPTFIRRSFSSNGMMEYTIEQFGASTSRFKGVGLPSVTMEEKEEDESKPMELKNVSLSAVTPSSIPLQLLNDNDLSTKKENTNLPSENNASDSTKNRKFFSHYDVAPSKKTPSNSKSNCSELNCKALNGNETLIKDEIMNLTSSTFAKIDQNEFDEINENLLKNDALSIKSKPQEKDLISNLSLKLSNDSSLNPDSTKVSSQHCSPHSKFTPKTLNTGKKDKEFSALNINGTNYVYDALQCPIEKDCTKLHKNVEEKTIPKNEHYLKSPVQDLSLSCNSDLSKENVQNFVHESSSNDLHPTPKPKKPLSRLSFQSAFNKNRSTNSSTSSYLYSKDNSQVQLLKFTQSKEFNYNSLSKFSNNYLTTKSCIKAIHYELKKGVKDIDIDTASTFSYTNSSKVCSIM